MVPVQPGASVASFAGVGKFLNYAHNYAFAYSGIVDVADTETTLIRYKSSVQTFIGTWQGYYYESVYGEDFRFILYLNNLKVAAFTTEGSTRGHSRATLHIGIPAFTEVKITAENVSDDTSREMMASIVGRLYGAE